LQAVGRALLLLLNVLLVLVGVVQCFVGVVFMVGGASDPEFGGTLTAVGLGCLLVGAAMTVGGVVWWIHRLRPTPAVPPGPLVAPGRPEVAVARMNEANAAFQTGDLSEALTALWDEVYEASRRNDREQLAAIKALAEKIQQASPAKKRIQKKATQLVETAAALASSHEPIDEVAPVA
jgi:hypothetical protein